MKLETFINRINALSPKNEELRAMTLPTSIRGEWLIEVVDHEFTAYDTIVDQIIFCCAPITTFSSQVEFKYGDEVGDYYLFGENPHNGLLYALEQLSEEILLLDNTDYSIYQKIASDEYAFLDALFEAATLFRKDIFDRGTITESDRMEVALACANLAAIPAEPQFWIEFVGA